MARSAVPGKSRSRGSLALLLGLGGLATAGASADASTTRAGIGTAMTGEAAGVVIISAKDGRICLREGAGAGRELLLSDTPETRRLLDLIQGSASGADTLSVRPTLMAGDGGAGFHWAPATPPASRKNNAPAKARVHPAQHPETPQPERVTKPETKS